MKFNLESLKGKKTYILAAVMVVAGVLEGLGIITVPGWVWPLLGASGLGFLRAGVTGVRDSIQQSLAESNKKKN